MSSNPQLELSVEEMRRLGYQAIDEIVAHFEKLNDKPAIRVGTRAGYRDWLFLDRRETVVGFRVARAL